MSTPHRFATRTFLLILAFLLTFSTLHAAELPASLTGLKPTTQTKKEGRNVQRYEHGPHYFYVIPADGSIASPPLRVILHHAGGSGDRALNEAFGAKHRHQYVSKEYCALYLDCRNEQKDNWWWGWHVTRSDTDQYKGKLQATEQRVLDTIEWVIKEQNVDRNRVYLSGRSMGGSGSLGIGWCRADIFASIMVSVPAGADHGLFRMKSAPFPDPAPLFNISSQTDGWSKGQENLPAFCHEEKLPLLFAWGPFGHASRPNMAHPGVYDFPWLSIVRNEAYPVFTDADSDDTYPGHKNTTAKDQKGQINGCFRWKNLEDTPERFSIELRLVAQKELGSPVDLPKQATADVTLRRLQKFAIKPDTIYNWSVVRDGKVTQKGSQQADKEGLLTIPKIVIAEPASLTLKAR